MPSHFSRPLPMGVDGAGSSSAAATGPTDNPYPGVKQPDPPIGARASIEQATEMLMSHYSVSRHDALRILVHWSCLCDTNPIAIAETLTTVGVAAPLSATGGPLIGVGDVLGS